MPLNKIMSVVPGLQCTTDATGVAVLKLAAGVSLAGPRGATGANGPRGASGASGSSGAMGGTGPAGPPGPAATVEIELVSAESISAFTVVTSDGYEADSNDISTFARAVGIAKVNIAGGFNFAVVPSGGEITNPAWAWARGDRLFLNGTAISTIPPSTGYSQFIGTALAADTIAVEIGPAILL